MLCPKIYIGESQGECDSFLFKDTTGAFSLETNQGGYGTPNLLGIYVTKVELLVKFPDGRIYKMNRDYRAGLGLIKVSLSELVLVSQASTTSVCLPCEALQPTSIFLFNPPCPPEEGAMGTYFNPGCYEFTYKVYAGTSEAPVFHAGVSVVHFLHCQISHEIDRATKSVIIDVDKCKGCLTNGLTQAEALGRIMLANATYQALLHECSMNCNCAKDKVLVIRSLISNLVHQC
jgi:hypothetical protein